MRRRSVYEAPVVKIVALLVSMAVREHHSEPPKTHWCRRYLLEQIRFRRQLMQVSVYCWATPFQCLVGQSYQYASAL